MRDLSLPEAEKLLKSKDYKQRLIGEYYEIRNRALSLDAVLDSNNGAGFDCPYDVLNAQSNAMWTYLSILEVRAANEGIIL